jgi:hypothetical protein
MVFKGISMLVAMFFHFCNDTVFFIIQASYKFSKVWGVCTSTTLVPKTGSLKEKCKMRVEIEWVTSWYERLGTGPLLVKLT